MKRTIIFLLIAGCGTSGVVPMGPDTFMISGSSSTGFHSGGSVTADLYREAGAYCAAQGKKLVPVNQNSRDGVPGRAFANAELQFRCLTAGDPELQRPRMEPVPNVRIESK